VSDSSKFLGRSAPDLDPRKMPVFLAFSRLFPSILRSRFAKPLN